MLSVVAQRGERVEFRGSASRYIAAGQTNDGE